MKLKLMLPIVFLVFALIDVASAQQAPKNTLAARFAKLQTDYAAAASAYYAPFEQAKTDEERSKIKLDPTKNPALSYYKKFRQLAMDAGKSDVAFDAWMMSLRLAHVGTEQVEAINHLVDRWSNSPKIASLIETLQYMIQDLPSKEREAKLASWRTKLRKSTNREVLAALLYSDAKEAQRKGADVKAREMLAQLGQKYPNTAYGKTAAGDIFEMDHLTVGKIAPDFKAEDQDGVKFKLSDYRGKVVVLDFWGFW